MKQLFLRRPYLLSALYFPIYMLWFNWLQQRHTPHTWMHCSLDDVIPFCSWFVIPYVLWFAFVAGTVIYFFRSPEECLRLCTFLYGGMTICLLVYTLLPNGQLLRPTVMPDNHMLTQLVFFIYRLDPSVNVCPSIHVFATLGVQNAILRSPLLREKRPVLISTVILSLLIILSTMFLKQHSVVDVSAAVLLGFVMNHLVYRNAPAAHRIFAGPQKLPS